jgi:hypothetical protein
MRDVVEPIESSSREEVERTYKKWNRRVRDVIRQELGVKLAEAGQGAKFTVTVSDGGLTYAMADEHQDVRSRGTKR